MTPHCLIGNEAGTKEKPDLRERDQAIKIRMNVEPCCSDPLSSLIVEHDADLTIAHGQ